MTRDEILKKYRLTKTGRIENRGKFQGEPIYAPYFYEHMIEGGGHIYEEEDDDTTITEFEVTDSDREEFTELKFIKIVRVWLTEDGFICTEAIA